jgi:hypothetical protein
LLKQKYWKDGCLQIPALNIEGGVGGNEGDKIGNSGVLEVGEYTYPHSKIVVESNDYR